MSDTAPTPHLHQHQTGMLEALPLGTRCIAQAVKVIRPHEARFKELCKANGVDFDQLYQHLLVHAVNWRAYSGALSNTINANPGARVVAVFGERWLPPKPEGVTELDYVLDLDPIRALLQVCDHASRRGCQTHIITTGGVFATEKIAGEVNARDLMRYVELALGQPGFARVNPDIDTTSLNTGDQGNRLGGSIGTLLAQHPDLPIIFVPVLPAVHQARFAPTILAGVEKMLPGVVRGRPNHLKTPAGEPIVKDGVVDMGGLATRLKLVPFTTYDMETYQPQRQMSMAEEAFGTREPAGRAALPSKALGDEYGGRLIVEMGPKGAGYACHAAPPNVVHQFLPQAVLTDFQKMHTAFLVEAANTKTSAEPPKT